MFQNTSIQQSSMAQHFSALSFFIIILLLGTFFLLLLLLLSVQLLDIYLYIFVFSIFYLYVLNVDFWVILYLLIKIQTGIKLRIKKQQQLLLFSFEPLLSLYTKNEREPQPSTTRTCFFVPRDVFFLKSEIISSIILFVVIHCM